MGMLKLFFSGVVDSKTVYNHIISQKNKLLINLHLPNHIY